MEDIEDVVVAGAPPVLRLPLTAVVVKPKKKPRARSIPGDPLSHNPLIPGSVWPKRRQGMVAHLLPEIGRWGQSIAIPRSRVGEGAKEEEIVVEEASPVAMEAKQMRSPLAPIDRAAVAAAEEEEVEEENKRAAWRWAAWRWAARRDMAMVVAFLLSLPLLVYLLGGCQRREERYESKKERELERERERGHLKEGREKRGEEEREVRKSQEMRGIVVKSWEGEILGREERGGCQRREERYESRKERELERERDGSF